MCPETAAREVAPPLSPLVLDRRSELPIKPEPVSLEGELITLRPLDLARDIDALHVVSDGRTISVGTWSTRTYDPDREIWRYLSGGPFGDPSALATWLRGQQDALDGRPFTVIERRSGHPVGVANIMSNQPAHLKVELGNIWYGPVAQRTGANTEATRLLCGHLFGLGYRRVEWKCDALNERSRATALRMGFRFEGIQQRHLIVKDRDRDTAWFRILDEEWPELETRLRAMLGSRPA